MVDAFGALALLAWLYLALAHGRFWQVSLRRGERRGARARVAVIIPARDEAATIAETVSSLTAQDCRIWVVDDSSTDGTAEYAREAGGDRTTVLSAPPPEPGWTGKLWALSRGVDAALETSPDYLLFTDADIRHAPDSIASLIALAEADQADLVSYMVHLHCVSVPEKLTIPAFVFFFFMLYPPRWIADPRRSTAGAAGGCILIRRSALMRIGGIASIRGELIDDCALARAVKSSGGRIRLGLTSDTISTRAYSGFSEIWQMISRTAFTQLQYSSLLLIGTIAGMLLLYAAPVISALRGSLYGALAWLLMAALFIPMLRFYRQPVLLALLLPLIACFYMGATVDSALRYWTGRGGVWKGRKQAGGVRS